MRLMLMRLSTSNDQQVISKLLPNHHLITTQSLHSLLHDVHMIKKSTMPTTGMMYESRGISEIKRHHLSAL